MKNIIAHYAKELKVTKEVQILTEHLCMISTGATIYAVGLPIVNSVTYYKFIEASTPKLTEGKCTTIKACIAEGKSLLHAIQTVLEAAKTEIVDLPIPSDKAKKAYNYIVSLEVKENMLTVLLNQY